MAVRLGGAEVRAPTPALVWTASLRGVIEMGCVVRSGTRRVCVWGGKEAG
jgi:hypothetical protein